MWTIYQSSIPYTIQMDIHSDLHLPLVTITSLESKRKL